MNYNSSITKQIKNNFRIGIAIATYNSAEVIKNCLAGLKNKNYTIVIFDDASTDRTLDIAKAIIPDLVVLNGDGFNWWGGGTAKAVDKCFSIGCDFVLMLNPDAIISSDDIDYMVENTSTNPKLITAGLVVRNDDETKLLWGGSRRVNLLGFAMLTNRYIYKKNSKVHNIDLKPYETHEVHGRGVLISRPVYDTIGTLDWREFPHYGADNDYSLRAQSAGIKLKILPKVKVRLVAKNSGMKLSSKPFSILRFCEVYNFLTKRKNGEYASVIWRLARRHCSFLTIIPTFVLNLIYIVFRKLSQSRLII